MCKEIWLQNYESKIEQIADEKNIEWEAAEKILEQRLERNPGYLDDYFYETYECYGEY